MADPYETREPDTPPEPDHAPPTRLPSTDPFQTRGPSSYPDTRPEPFDASIPTRIPVASTEDYEVPPPGHRESPPSTFPGYELLGTLGEGGMGIVYKARQEGLNRLVALKVILGGHKAGPKELIRFLAEAESVASIKHPNVVQVHEYGEADGRPFLAMEYLSGGTLADKLRGRKRLDPLEAAELVAKLARAVQAAHDQEIVHRDLKPGNVLFDDQGEPKVADFGLAKRTKGSDTQTQAVMGTPAYMSPEQAQGKSKFVGPPADVYALGVILYECLTGIRPFDHEDTRVLLCRVLVDDPEPPSKHIPSLPRDLELITLKCLAKDPAERYSTAGALADDLARFLAGEPVTVRAPGTIERALKWARRKPTQAAAYVLTVAVVVLLAFGASLAVLWRDAETARLQAEKARDSEKKARAEVEVARESLARIEYGRTMKLAHQEWRDGNFIGALALLEGTRSDLRGWEWGYVRRLCHGEQLELKGHDWRVYSVAFSPDGSRIVTASMDNTARVWDARSGKQLLLKEHGSASTVAFSPDGSRIATAGRNAGVWIWDARSGEQLLELKGETTWVLSVAFSPDGSRILTTSRDHTARVWDANFGTELLVLEGHSRDVTSVAFSPDGSRIATASDDKTARVWDAQSGRELLVMKGRDAVPIGLGTMWGRMTSVAFSPDGSRIATASDDKTAAVWDAESGAQLFELKGHMGCVNAIAFSPDGPLIATASDDGTARVWDASSGDFLLELKGHTGAVNSVAFSPDGSRIATASDDKTARVWDARSDPELLTLVGSTKSVASASFSPDGSRIVTGNWDNTARVWDARSGAELLKVDEVGDRLVGASKGVTSASFNHDGSRFIAARLDGILKVRDSRSGAELLELNEQGPGSPVASYSPDDTRIVTAGLLKVARIWDANSGELLLELEGHLDLTTSAAFSPDGSRIATASQDGTARVWDVQSGRELLVLKGHDIPPEENVYGHMTSVAFSPDGSRIATASDDRTVSVWDAKSGAELLILRGHMNTVASVAFSPDGSRIATASRDGMVGVWDAKSGAELLTLKGHTAEVNSVAFSPDGSRILTASDDDSALVWDSRSPAELYAVGR